MPVRVTFISISQPFAGVPPAVIYVLCGVMYRVSIDPPVSAIVTAVPNVCVVELLLFKTRALTSNSTPVPSLPNAKFKTQSMPGDKSKIIRKKICRGKG